VPLDSLEPRVTVAEPWRRRPDWASGRVKDESASTSSRIGLVVGWMFALFWFGGLFVFTLIVRGTAERHGQRDHSTAYLILGLFALAGLVPLAFVMKEARHRTRYGAAVFGMSAVPGVIGGRLEGTVEIPGLRRGARVRANLGCWMASGQRKFPDQLMWEVPPAELAVDFDSPPRVPVSFEIPFECSASNPDGLRPGVYWRLDVEGLEGAPGLDASFIVPVFVTPESRAPEKGGPRAVAARPPETSLRTDRPAVDVLRLRYDFGPAAILSCVILPIALPVALVLLWPRRGDEGWETAWTTTLVATPLVIAFALATHFTEVMRVEIAGGMIVVSRGYRGWFGARRLAVADVRRVDLETTYNNYKQVVARTQGKGNLEMSRWTPVMEAHAIADALRSAIVAEGGTLEE
jgi:hypothetical protein